MSNEMLEQARMRTRYPRPKTNPPVAAAEPEVEAPIVCEPKGLSEDFELVTFAALIFGGGLGGLGSLAASHAAGRAGDPLGLFGVFWSIFWPIFSAILFIVTAVGQTDSLSMSRLVGEVPELPYKRARIRARMIQLGVILGWPFIGLRTLYRVSLFGGAHLLKARSRHLAKKAQEAQRHEERRQRLLAVEAHERKRAGQISLAASLEGGELSSTGEES